MIIYFRGNTDNGIWSEWSPWNKCFGDCHLSIQSRWRHCNHGKQLVCYLHCVGQPFETKNCIIPQCHPPPVLPSIYPGGGKTGGRKTRFTKPGGDKLHNQMDVKLSEKKDTGKGGPNSESDENNPDFHVHCNIQCRPGEDCQKLRAQCLKAGQGRAKVKVSKNKIKIETAPGETGLEGSSMTVSRKGAELEEKPIVEPPELFHPAEFRMAVQAAKNAAKNEAEKAAGKLRKRERKTARKAIRTQASKAALRAAKKKALKLVGKVGRKPARKAMRKQINKAARKAARKAAKK